MAPLFSNLKIARKFIEPKKTATSRAVKNEALVFKLKDYPYPNEIVLIDREIHLNAPLF
jgi:hypothetical protein